MTERDESDERDESEKFLFLSEKFEGFSMKLWGGGFGVCLTPPHGVLHPLKLKL